MLSEYIEMLLEEHNSNVDEEHKIRVRIDMDYQEAWSYMNFLKDKVQGNHNYVYQVEDDLKQYRKIEKTINDFEEFCNTFFSNCGEE